MNRGALMQIEYNFRGKIQNLKLQIYKIPKKIKKKTKQKNKQTNFMANNVKIKANRITRQQGNKSTSTGVDAMPDASLSF